MNDLERLAGPNAARDITTWAAHLLRRARRHTGTSASELADLSGIPEHRIAAIETSQLQPTLPELSQLLIAMGKELRIRLEDFDDQDKVLGERAVAFPERHAASQASGDRLGAAVTDQPPVRGRERSDEYSADNDGPAPVYRVRQPGGHSVTVDLSTLGTFGDFAFTVRSSRGTVRFSAYHTGETAIFVDALTRYLSELTLEQRQASLCAIREELDRITAGRTMTERGEDKFTTLQLDMLGRPVDPTESTFRTYRTSGGSDLVLTSTADALDIALVSDDGEVRSFSWPVETLWQLLAGMVWRSYAEPGDDFSLLSRIPTAEYLAALQAAEQGS